MNMNIALQSAILNLHEGKFIEYEGIPGNTLQNTENNNHTAQMVRTYKATTSWIIAKKKKLVSIARKGKHRQLATYKL